MQYGAIIKQGGSTPCCEWQLPAFKGLATEYATSDYLDNIKRKMLEHDMDFLNESCVLCINQERFGIPSRRVEYHKQHQHDDKLPERFLYYNYRPSNLCNLKCRMCIHLSSSQIAKEMGIELNLRDTSDFHDIDFSGMELISIAGGEPSIDPLVHTFLRKLIDDGLAKDVELTFTTNGTNINDRWKSLISGFKQTSVIVSLDGTGPTFDYIRTNASWESVEKNCEEYKKHANVLTYQITATVLNIISIEDWLPWFSESGVNTTIWPVDGNEDTLTLNTIPDEIREEKIRYLSNVGGNVAETVSLMLRDTRFEMHAYRNLLEWSERMDRIRKTDIRSVSAHHARLVGYFNT